MRCVHSLIAVRRVLFAGVLIASSNALALFAQTTHFDRQDPESFRIEIMASGWLLDSRGQIQASGTPADFVSDLGVEQRQGTFFGRLVFKPARRHRIEIEGTPLGLNGLNTITRNILFQGRTFTVNQTVSSNASLDYLFVGYQYDVVSGRSGHLGFSVGGAYLAASGTLATQVSSLGSTTNVSATRTETIGLPLAGFDFRLFPWRGHSLFELEGGMRGMALGDYGYYAHAIGQGGISLGPFTVLAGYRAVNTSIYVTSNGSPSGLTARLHGPLFSAMFRW